MRVGVDAITEAVRSLMSDYPWPYQLRFRGLAGRWRKAASVSGSRVRASNSEQAATVHCREQSHNGRRIIDSGILYLPVGRADTQAPW